LWQYDYSLRRITVIGPDGRLARIVTLPSVRIPATATTPAITDEPYPLALAPEGILVRATRERYPIDPSTGILPNAARQLAFVNTEGRMQRVVAHIPPSSGGLLIVERGMYGVGNPYIADPKEAIAVDGSRIAYVTTNITSPRGGTIRVTVLAPSGDTVLARDYPFVGRRLTRRDANAGIERGLATFAGRLPREIVSRLRDVSRRDAPPIHPYIDRVVLGHKNTTWLQPEPVDGKVHWIMLDHLGSPTLTVIPPPRHIFVTGSTSHVWMISTDDDGISSVGRYRIERSVR
jgi:hypothetical protein